MSANFVQPLEKLGFIDGVKWRVESEVVYFSEVLKRCVTVPIGRITDFASIPRPLWNIYPPAKFAQAAVIHDELYTLQTVTRSEADKVFLEALDVCGVPYLRRYAFYWALRAAGWAAWNSHARENKRLNAGLKN